MLQRQQKFSFGPGVDFMLPDPLSLNRFQAPSTRYSVTLLWTANERAPMPEKEAVKQSADLLRKIIRSVDKKLDYKFIDPAQEGKFALELSIRGRTDIVSLVTEDLRLALSDNVRKNTVRQKIKATRDHLLSDHVADVMGTKVARMLKQSGGDKDESKSSFFYRRPQGRR